MTQYYVPIEEQLLILNALIIEATRSLEKKPEGSLLVHQKGGSSQYYWKKGSCRSYLPSIFMPFNNNLRLCMHLQRGVSSKFMPFIAFRV